MKLSLRKRFGWIHCKGGAIVKVAREHAVTSDTLECRKGRESRKYENEPDWVFTKVGNLAVEIVAVKTGKLLGHCYLTGPAAQMHRYTPAQSDWFEPASARLGRIPHPSEIEAKDQDDLFLKMMDAIMDIRFSSDDLVAFRLVCKDKKDTDEAGGSIHDMLQLQKIGDERVQTANILGLIVGPRGKPSIALHHQPDADASEHSASDFGLSLVLSSLEARN